MRFESFQPAVRSLAPNCWARSEFFYIEFSVVKMLKKECVFNDQWLSDSKKSAWLQLGAGLASAKCKLRKSPFNVSKTMNTGEAALKCHAEGKKCAYSIHIVVGLFYSQCSLPILFTA